MHLAARFVGRFARSELVATSSRIRHSAVVTGRRLAESEQQRRDLSIHVRRQYTFAWPTSDSSCATLQRAHASTKTNPSSRTSAKDPEPQTGLYYHPTQISVSHGNDQPVETVEAWALSFLSEPPKSEDAVIAYLLPPSTCSTSSNSSALQMAASDPAGYIRAYPDRVRINTRGWQIMHDVLRTEVVPQDALLQFEADTRESGWAHLTDLRQPLMPGRIATPESIIASVAFVDGQLDVDSYQINESYRLVTGYEGPIQMADSWIQKIRRHFQSL